MTYPAWHSRAVFVSHLLVASLVACGLAACGGTTGGPEVGTGGVGAESGGGSGGGTGGIDFTGGSGGSSGGSGAAPASGGAGTGGTGGRPYVEVQCPDEQPPPPEQECDPLAGAEDCGDGEGCYPYLVYPPGGERCGLPSFGSVCAAASTGTQGQQCSGTTQNYCEPGFLCVVGSGGGARCARLCLTSAPDCPSGLICTETDVQDYGVCF